MNKMTVLITLIIGLIALVLLVVAGNSSYLSTKVSGIDDCRSLCQESCQGFATSAEAELCQSECQAMCAESY